MMENANTQLTLRSSRRNNQASQQQQQQTNEQPVEGSSQQFVRVRDQCSEWGCRTTCWSIDPQGNIQEAVVFDPARVGPSDLENPDPLRPEDRISWTDMKKIKTLHQQETDARESVTNDPVRFRCLYCESTFKNMKSCKEHVVGRTHSREKSWHIQCMVRKIREEIPDDGFVQEGSYLPMMFPWAGFTCVDADYEEGEEKFTIPAKLQHDFDLYHIDLIQPQNCPPDENDENE